MVLTQIFDKLQHDTADMQVAFNPESSFDIEIGDFDRQRPRSVADYEAVGQHFADLSIDAKNSTK